jgi:hypothetical protein
MKKRVAWRLAVVLTVGAMGGVLITRHRLTRSTPDDAVAQEFRKRGLVIGYKSHLPPLWRRVTFLPRSDWGFGRYGEAMVDESSATVFQNEEKFKLGFIQVRVK